MALSISTVVLLGVIVFIFIRKGGMRIPHAIVCALLGFYLASTSIAPSIHSSGKSVANLLSNLNF
ncbi:MULTISPECIES: DUF2304 domain-containing protein [Embleya]|uniref:DUF2304 domain-containing protein n=1 Tax=Embleya hyalina TaxID=516124 RepID=A0A401YSJ5_9ACTN|nr:DUF2304 domain-containing protein [Embleya hyalina]WSY11651.1 DUF2304 domain-containing protein [Embleya sp. NBC_00896]WSY42151.1 DUF2304 domain-containing protein [Embleya sp. NBC_00888]GCD97542.1 hypothetical protein EHYA_05235 [Embleya hyalina]